MNEPMTTITMRPQNGAESGEYLPGQPVEFCVSGEVAEKLSRYAALEHVAVPVFFRRLIRAGLYRYEYQGGF